jgi:CubicO group peptidase (beta-lactamase class C family)
MDVKLAELAAKYRVPGVSLAVWHDGTLTEHVHGVLNTATGVAVTPDSLFQIGSITKVFTATLVMSLVDDLDTPVAQLLPEFVVADAQATASVTVRHLLTHTSGIDGDLFLDTGRGDDCVAKYVAACADLKQNHPVGVTQSYCNAGYVILGRLVEHLTGKTWDTALRELLLEPAGLNACWTLPEEVLRFRSALGHDDTGTKPVPQWGLMRAMGPAGLLNATAADVVGFARLHLEGGRGILTPGQAAAMRQPQVELPDKWTSGSHWGLGWILDTWPGGQRVFSHGGTTIGQFAMLYALPDRDLAVAVLLNGGDSAAFLRAVCAEVFAGHGITMPDRLAPPPVPVNVDMTRHAGQYERKGIQLELVPSEAGLSATLTPTGPLAALGQRKQTFSLVPLNSDLCVVQLPGSTAWHAVVFYQLANGASYVHFGGRATPKRAHHV